MLIVHSKNRVSVRLTEERWRHIARRHPEMDTQQGRVLETVASPDLIQEGDRGETLPVRKYARTPLREKYLAVAYREMSTEDGFIITAYLTTQLRWGIRTLWTRSES